MMGFLGAGNNPMVGMTDSKGLRYQIKPQFTNTLDFRKHKTIPYLLHMGMGLCYNTIKQT